MSLYDIQKKFWQEVKEIIEKNQLKNMYVNCHIASVLSDSFYDYRYDKKEIGDYYKIGSFHMVDVIVNPNMKFNDLRIMSENGEVYYDFSEEYKTICLI